MHRPGEKKRIVQRPDEPVLFTASEPPCLLQKVRMIRVIRLHKLTVQNDLVKRGEVWKSKWKKGAFPASSSERENSAAWKGSQSLQQR